MARKLRHPLLTPASEPAEDDLARRRALAQLITNQHGVIALVQLTSSGFSRRSIARRLQDGRLYVLHRGVYAIHAQISQRGHWLAAVLACGEGALLSHGSAAALWGLARPFGSVDVTCPRGRAGRQGIRLHQGKVHATERDSRDRIPVTSVARTLFDLAEVLDEERLKQAWEEADRLNLLELGAVAEICDRNPGRRALRPIRGLLVGSRAPTTTRSPLEDRFAEFCGLHGLPAYATNVDVMGREVDALWPRARLIVELDGFAFHGHRAAFERDRARDSALQAAGYRTIRVTHYRLDHEAPTLLGELRSLLGIQD